MSSEEVLPEPNPESEPAGFLEADSISEAKPFIVAIGAGIGGKEALHAFFSQIPEDSGIAFIVICPPFPAEELINKIATATDLPVSVAVQSTTVQANHIYIGSATGAILQDGFLRSANESDESQTTTALATPIDALMHSLVEDQGADSIGIILSGGGSDGAIGLKMIADANGMTMVQDSASAEYDSMPRSAALSGNADHVLPPQRLAGELLEYVEYLRTHNTQYQNNNEQKIKSALAEICDVLMQASEHDFRHYKTSTLVRRIQRRMQVLRIAEVSAYLQRLNNDSEEARALFLELLIGVTAFLRDPEAFSALTREVIPKLLSEHEAGQNLRIWVPGCASGEEAYTLAILLREQMEQMEAAPPEVQIFATDIDERALALARKGSYPLGIIEDLGAERLQRFFTKKDNRYQVNPNIRELCLFSRHNLISDPPLSRLDLISCRNLLIYLGSHLQKKLIPLFHQALRPGGYLFLGPAENLISHQDLFQPVSSKYRISRRKASTVDNGSNGAATAIRRTNIAPTQRIEHNEEELQQLAQHIVLDEFAPKYVVINDSHEILCTSDGTNRYLELRAGSFSNNLVRLARSGLRVGLRTALSEAHEQRRQIVRDNLSVQTDAGVQPVSITVQPMPQMGEDSGLFIVVFHDAGPELTAAAAHQQEQMDPSETLISQLERELAQSREDLEKTVQELEAANEELRSSNEELRTLNEELQATNEELEASKDEVQSINNALIKTNNNLENLLKSTEIATIFLDSEKNIQWFTPAATDIYNLIASDIGRPLTHLTHHAIPEMPPLPEQAQLQQNEDIIEDEIALKNGDCYLRRVSLYNDHQGTAQGIVVTFIDVSELRESDRQAREWLSEIESVYESVPIGLCVFDTNLRYLRVNRHLADLHGYSVESHIGKSIRELLPDLADQIEAPLRKILESGEPLTDFEVSTEIPEQPGVVRTWLKNWYPLRDETGRIVAINAVVEDITERKQTEETLRLRDRAIAAATNGILITDARQDDNPIVYVNDSFEQLTGYSSEEALGRNCRFLQGSETDPKALDSLRQAIREQREHRIELLNYKKDGTPFWNELYVSPIEDEQGEVTHFIGIQNDINDRKQFEQSLREAERAAAEASRSKSEFLANISHEIRTPMTAILGYAEIMATNSDNPDNLECIETIKRNGRYLLEIVNDILDLSKIEAGKLEVRIQPCSPVELIADVHSLMEVRAQEKQLPLKIDYANPVPEQIQTDPVRLRQILINLLSNAIKFTEQGEVELRISYQADNTQPQLKFDVQDTGIGLTLEQQQQLFQPFTQVESHNSRRYGGTGLGLSISRRLAQMLGGAISVESTPQEGSTFTLMITADIPADASMIEPQSDIIPKSSPSARSIGTLDSRVLVVDDRRDIRYLAQHFIEEAGAEVVTANNGKAAIQAVQKAEDQNKPFDVIVMDMQMPVMDGYQATVRLRSQGFKQPIIALTAGAMQGERKRCLQAGCNDFLSKPIESQRLIEVLARYIQRDDAHQAKPLQQETTSSNIRSTQQDSSASGSDDNVQQQKRCRVLLVDDSEDSCEALSRLLSMMNHEVQVAHNGRNAISRASEFHPDAVILDIGLPDIDGYEVATRLRETEEFADTVLIALSGSAADPARLNEAGFDHHVMKPASINDLLKLLPGN